MNKWVTIGKKKLTIPIIQGGMGVGVSLSGLAGAVMKEGGMGVISAAHPGYRKKDFWKNSRDVNIIALKEEIQIAKQHAQGNGLCGVNVMVASENYEQYAKAAIDGGADAIISGAGLPLNLPSIEGSEHILLAPIVSSARACTLILKSWDRHYQRCPDFIVIEGSLAGGHLGFKKDLIDLGTAQTLDEILPEVLAAIEPYKVQYKKEIPVFVAGGVYTHEDIVHFQSIGASGVQMATRFIATHECDANIAFKQKIINSTKETTVLVHSPAGLPGRAVKTKYMEEANIRRMPPSRCVKCIKPCHPPTTPYCISEALINAVSGDVENGLVFAGANAWRVDTIVSVHDLVKELMGEEEAK